MKVAAGTIVLLMAVMKSIWCFRHNIAFQAKSIYSRSINRPLFMSTFDEKEAFRDREAFVPDVSFTEGLVARPHHNSEKRSLKRKRAFGKGELVIFVVDMSMPGAAARIQSVNSAVHSILPYGKVSVVGCMQGNAKVVLKPTSSVLAASRHGLRMKRSVMGNVAAGIRLSQDMANDALLSGDAQHVTVAVVADGKAHGLRRSGGATCNDDLCDVELLESAWNIAEQKRTLQAMGLQLDTVVVDTASAASRFEEWSAEGMSLATATNADYYHAARLTGKELMKILMNVKEQHGAM